MISKDLKLVINGENDTYIDLTQSVDGYLKKAQNCLVVSVTSVGSDKAFPEKGTDLLKGSVGVYNLVNPNYVAHLGNFAALNTISFIKNTELDKINILKGIYGDSYEIPVTISDVDIVLNEYVRNIGKVNFDHIVYFSDGTSTQNLIQNDTL